MGSYKDIGSFSHGQQWAHTRLSAAFLIGSNGPIQEYRQLFSWLTMGPYHAIGSFSPGPIQCYCQLYSWAAMGPYNAIGSFSHGQKWAHTRISAAFLMVRNGPIQ